jgi:protein ImuA
MTEPQVLSLLPSPKSAARSAGTSDRAALVAELRRLVQPARAATDTLPFDLPALDSHLPDGGLPRGGLHEIVPATEGATAAAFGFVLGILALLPRHRPLIFVMPAYAARRQGRLSGHGLAALGLDPTRAILVETTHRKETLWALAEALHSGAPGAVVGMIDRLDLKTSQKLQLAAGDCGLPLLLLRPAPSLETSAASTRWRIDSARSERDRFGMLGFRRWHLHLERCRNGRSGEWVVEYDHVAHRFSLAATLADPASARGASARPMRTAARS